MKKINLSKLVFVLLLLPTFHCIPSDLTQSPRIDKRNTSDWFPYGQRPSGDNLYYDKNNIDSRDGIITLWVLADFVTPNQKSMRSGSANIQIDCSQKKYKYLKFAYYTQQMAVGDIADLIFKANPKWIAIKKQPPYLKLLELACAK